MPGDNVSREALPEDDSNKSTQAMPQTDAEQSDQQRPSLPVRLWRKLDLDLFTVLLMLKASLPPTIAIAAYQSRAFAQHFGTLGYLVAIVSVMGFCIMPRGKFVQTMILNLVAISLASAINLLALFCAIKARQHTTPAGRPPIGYNSSASAVLAIWFIFQTYLINALRAARPQFQFPAILYSIFLAVSATYGTQFPTMAYATSFMKQLLEAFLTGFALATAVSLLIVPVSSRQVVFKEITGYLMSLSGLLEAQTQYMQDLEEYDPRASPLDQDDSAGKAHGKKPSKAPTDAFLTPRALKVQEMLQKLLELHGKLPGDLLFAKREVAIGKLGARHLTEIWKILQQIMIPVVGLTSVIDILRRLSKDKGYDAKDKTEEQVKSQDRQLEDVHSLMKALHEPFGEMAGQIHAAFQHCLITMQLIKAPKPQDEENTGDEIKPGTPGFAAAYKKRLDGFYDSKKQTLRDWCHEHDIELHADFFESTFVSPESLDPSQEHAREKGQRQLFFMLYVEYLLWRAGSATLELVLWADKQKQDGVLSKTRIIFPAVKTLRKWAASVFRKEDTSKEDHFTAEMEDGAMESLDLGESFSRRKDPEHLPPRNFGERLGNAIRLIPKALRSDASAFGFRVAAATMTIGIVCFLEASQAFFLKNRLLWAMIMVSISMTRTAGQSIATFMLRVIGTTIAMIGAYIIWYIVDGRSAGVIVFLWLWMFLANYVVLKKPKLVIVAILSLVTALLIIGYELEVQILGERTIESNGQPAYPTYTLAPYRLATVVCGLAVAFVWTIFPFPISESTELRKDIGASLYLLANFYSIVHETVGVRIHQNAGNREVKGTREYHLEKARNAVFTKLIMLTSALSINSAFSKFQISLGGRFPREEYEALILHVKNLLRYFTLLSYASATFQTSDPATEWAMDFRKLLLETNHTSHQITSMLSLLSASLLQARPLPPYLEIPRHDRGVKRLNAIDHDILSIKHMAEPEYSAFAVIQICAQCINDDLQQIKKHVRTLVGEIDFSFHAVSTNQSSQETLTAANEKKLEELEDY